MSLWYRCMHLSLALLGTFQVICDDKPQYDFPTQAARALLAYLVLEPRRLHEREHLAGLLWPDLPAEHSLTNLRKTLHRLRVALDLPEGDAVLIVTRQRIGLAPGFDLDVHAFEQHIAATRTHRHRSLWTCSSCLAHLHAALALYQGELLSGFGLAESLPFEEWLLVRREALNMQFVDALDALATHHTARGNYADAATLLRRWIALEPWHEAAYIRLIEVLWRAGQPSAALRQFERCRAALATELGAEPSPESLTLVNTIRRGGRPSVRPIASLAVPMSEIPFVVRKRELAQIAELLATPECQLLTLIGPGGSGKTRLALEVAAEQAYAFTDGAVFVPLAHAQSEAEVLHAIAVALGIDLGTAQSAAAQLCHYLCDKELLLILDNFEHLLDSAAVVSTLLSATRKIQLLVTSRVPLNLRAEWLLPIRGMALPLADDAPANSYEAGQFFVQVVHQAQPEFVPTAVDMTAIATICRHVHGMPLAIELAATHVRTLSSQAVAAAIEANYELLATTMRDVPERHRSVRAVFTWSWNLLNEVERSLLARLSVFRGGFDIAAASAVAGAEVALLERLCQHSLLHCDEVGRYSVHELVRQFAAEQLSAEGELIADETADRHSALYLELAGSQETTMHGSAARMATALLGAEASNLSQAWQWAVTHQRSHLIAQGTRALSRFYSRTSLSDGVTFFASTVEQVRGTCIEPRVFGHLLITLAWFHNRYLQHNAAHACADEVLTLAASIGDVELEAEALLARGEALMYQSDHLTAMHCITRARTLIQRAELGSIGMRITARCLLGQGDVHYWQGHVRDAIRCAEEALHLYHEQGDMHYEGLTLNRLGEYERRRGDYSQSRLYRLRALALLRESGDVSIENRVLNDLGEVYLHLGCYTEACAYLTEAVELSRRIGDRSIESAALEGLGRAYLYLGNPERARACALQALALVLPGEHVNSGFFPTCLGYASEALGDTIGAEAAYREGIRRFAAQTTIRAGVEPLAGLARLALARRDNATAWAIGVQLHASLSLDSLCDALDPLRVHLTCYQALRAADDKRAEQILERAFTLLDQQAARISDADLRHSFLQRVPHHRVIQALIGQHRVNIAA